MTIYTKYRYISIGHLTEFIIQICRHFLSWQTRRCANRSRREFTTCPWRVQSLSTVTSRLCLKTPSLSHGPSQMTSRR